MLSVMNTNEFELDRKSDPTKPRASSPHHHDAISGRAGGKSVNPGNSEGVAGSGVIDDENIRACMDLANGEMKSKVSGSNKENGFSGGARGSSLKQLGHHETGVWNGKKPDSPKEGIEEVNSYDSMLSMFDEFAAGGGGGGGVAGPSSKPVAGHGYEVGDMVWGKVKSHPWWPGHIYNEEFATTSVRRSKREGHVLVAFFGDSSYGWFDPAELVPFDSNYAEKSQQTSSRTFVKAVEEAVDELSRRRGLGLACRCRNTFNFRPTDVEGYFAVDVGDFEPGAVYPSTQIKKARDSFQPKGALGFIQKLALAPLSAEHDSINFIKNKATVLAYRKAVFEEYDETYAQAFGYQAVRPSPKPPQDNVPGKISSRAPLSGRLVIAEALSKGKSTGKPSKPKDHAKKDKYLFKRRDESKELKTHPVGEVQPISSSQPVYIEGSSAIVDGDYVLQKRAPAMSAKPEQTGRVSSFGDITGKDGSIEDKTTASRIEFPTSSAAGETPPGYSSHHLEASSIPEMGKDVVLDTKINLGSDAAVIPRRLAGSSTGDDKLHMPGKVAASLHEDIPSSRVLMKGEGLGRTRSEPSTVESRGVDQSKDVPTEIGLKKVKVCKRPAGELSSNKAALSERKKKRKKELMSSDCMQMSVKDGGSVVYKVADRPPPSSLATKENSQADNQSFDARASTSSFDCGGKQQTSGIGKVELDLSELLSGLQALALDPFSGGDRRRYAAIRNVFLRYRSLVYQKSLALSPPAEDDANDSRAKSPVTATSDFPRAEDVEEVLRKKPQSRPSLRPDDPTKGGRKRGPSDRQEDIAAKKKKKVNDIRNLTVEKKVVQKTPETARGDSKQAVASVLKKAGEESLKRMKQLPPPRAMEPTMLVMKFPPGGNVPSVNELKARFFGFGQMDTSATRTFWKTLTCRVVFRDRPNAETAYRFVKNSSPFGEAKCYLRDVAAAASETEPGKVQKEDTSTGLLQPGGEPRPSSAAVPTAPGMQQLKSILKKSGSEEVGVGNGGNGGRGTPRVKFMLGGEEGSRGAGEQMMMIGNKNNFNNNASFADGGASSSTTTHATMDFNSKNFQKVNIPPHMLPPILPLPLPLPLPNTSSSITHAQFARPQNTLHYSTELVTPQPRLLPPPPPRNALHNYNTTPIFAPPSAPNVDIAPQMVSLLTKCNEVVNNVSNWLGYVPYHPL